MDKNDINHKFNNNLTVQPLFKIYFDKTTKNLFSSNKNARKIRQLNNET